MNKMNRCAQVVNLRQDCSSEIQLGSEREVIQNWRVWATSTADVRKASKHRQVSTETGKGRWKVGRQREIEVSGGFHE